MLREYKKNHVGIGTIQHRTIQSCASPRFMCSVVVEFTPCTAKKKKKEKGMNMDLLLLCQQVEHNIASLAASEAACSCTVCIYKDILHGFENKT